MSSTTFESWSQTANSLRPSAQAFYCTLASKQHTWCKYIHTNDVTPQNGEKKNEKFHDSTRTRPPIHTSFDCIFVADAGRFRILGSHFLFRLLPLQSMQSHKGGSLSSEDLLLLSLGQTTKRSPSKLDHTDALVPPRGIWFFRGFGNSVDLTSHSLAHSHSLPCRELSPTIIATINGTTWSVIVALSRVIFFFLFHTLLQPLLPNCCNNASLD